MSTINKGVRPWLGATNERPAVGGTKRGEIALIDLLYEQNVKEAIALCFFVLDNGRVVVTTKGGSNVNEWRKRYDSLARRFIDDPHSMETVHVPSKG